MKTLHCFASLAALASFAALPAQAQLLVQSSVSPFGEMFRYEYKVSNNTASDFSIITLGGLFVSDNTVQNLMAPSGFVASFDTGLGLLSFIEGTENFAAGTEIAGFSFLSSYAAGEGTFEALDFTGNLSAGMVAAVPATPVPEPSTYALAGAAALAALALRRRSTSAKS